MSRASFKRTARIASLIREVLAEQLQTSVKDPRLQGITITEVEVSGDLREAKVYFVSSRKDYNQDDVLDGLSRASGYLRKCLGERVSLRVTPSLNFVIDESLEYGARIESLIREINEGRTDDDDDL